jgi:hypothetical protein
VDGTAFYETTGSGDGAHVLDDAGAGDTEREHARRGSSGAMVEHGVDGGPAAG